MYNKLLVGICVLSLGLTAQVANAKKIKKTVVTEEIGENGKTIKKTETTETEAETEVVAEPEPVVTPIPDGLSTINESWYTLWGFGFSNSNYSGILGDAYEKDKSSAGADKSSMAVDLLGFYWPLEGHKTMLGFILNGSTDTLKLAGSEESITTSLLAFSAHHFFGTNIGNGWFLRGDIGFARASVDIDIGADHYNVTSDMGVGFLAGGGYGFALGRETRLLLGLYYRQVPKVKFDNGVDLKGSVTSVTAGFLF